MIVPGPRAAWREDERGGITLLVLSLFLGLVLVTGAALDLLRHEAMRSALQNRLDRAVLAAVSPRATGAPQEILRAHLAAQAGVDAGDPLSLGIDTHLGKGGRPQLAVTATREIETVFLGLIGVPRLGLTAQSAGPLAPRRIEVALAIDISLSMRHGGRLDALRRDITRFVEEGLQGPLRQRSRIALVPFAGRVNPGPWMFEAMGGRRVHDYSSCPEAAAEDFEDSAIPRRPGIAQAPHEPRWPIAGPWMGQGWCPSDPAMGYVHIASGRVTTWPGGALQGALSQEVVNGTAVTWPSQDPVALARRVDGLRLFHGSATHYGVLWGLATLDPANAAMIEGARTAEREGVLAPAEPPQGPVPDAPAPWGDPMAAKALVLITDGPVSETRQPDFRVERRTGLGGPTDGGGRPDRGRPDDGRAHLLDLCALAARRGVALHLIQLGADPQAGATLAACRDGAAAVARPGTPTPRLTRATAAGLAAALFETRRAIWGARLASWPPNG